MEHPKVGKVYRVVAVPNDILSTPEPWMVGRKVLIEKHVTYREMNKIVGAPTAHTDDLLERGEPMPDLEAEKRKLDEVAYYMVVVIARGRPTEFMLKPGPWWEPA